MVSDAIRRFNPMQAFDLGGLDSDVFDTDQIRLQFQFTKEDWSRAKCLDRIAHEQGTSSNEIRCDP